MCILYNNFLTIIFRHLKFLPLIKYTAFDISVNFQTKPFFTMTQNMKTTFFTSTSTQRLRYDLPNGFTYLQLGRDFINLFVFKYIPF